MKTTEYLFVYLNQMCADRFRGSEVFLFKYILLACYKNSFSEISTYGHATTKLHVDSFLLEIGTSNMILATIF